MPPLATKSWCAAVASRSWACGVALASGGAQQLGVLEQVARRRRPAGQGGVGGQRGVDVAAHRGEPGLAALQGD